VRVLQKNAEQMKCNYTKLDYTYVEGMSASQGRLLLLSIMPCDC